MKTPFVSKVVVASAGLIGGAVLSGGALAGPGPQYWRTSDQATEVVAPAPAAGMKGCPGAQTVPVTALKPSWSNARGPLTAVAIGTKTVCYTCPVTTTVATNGWSNGRGPVTRTEASKPGAAHDCGSGCSGVAAK